MRLDKLLCNLGVATRSGCRELLKSGRVQVGGETVRDGRWNISVGAVLTLDGKLLDTRLSRHVMLYKPQGVLTAAEDKKQKTVMDLLPACYAAMGCMPVGRLDKDTTGILLLTTDGELAHRLIGPKFHVNKVYEAQVEGELNTEDVAAFSQGIPLKDFCALPAQLQIVSPSLGRLTVQEGKYHQVKRMFGARGKPVIALHRLSFGPLSLDKALSPGEYRELTDEEAVALYAAAGMEQHE